MFEFFIEKFSNVQISPDQLGLKTGDSCIDQRLSITHTIYKSLDNGLEIKKRLSWYIKSFW